MDKPRNLQGELPLAITEPTTQAKPQRILRLAQVREVTGLGRSCIYQLQALRQFPQRIKIGVRAVGWIESEVQQWLAKRISQSRAPNGNLQP
jgi:prophage regulatory protein